MRTKRKARDEKKRKEERTLENPFLLSSLPPWLSTYLGDGDGGTDVESLAQVSPKSLLQEGREEGSVRTK